MTEVTVTIPDVGIPGSATPAQAAAVENFLGVKLDSDLSSDQAHLLLSARDYARAVVSAMAREGRALHHKSDIFMVARIMRDRDLREYVAVWSARCFARGSDMDNPRLRRNEHFWAVAEAGISSGL